MEDLDALILKCRNNRSRAYIEEATVCYKNGAFRAAIVSAWTAVVYDIIDKLRELALSGDHAAEQFVRNLDTWITENDVTSFLRMERTIVESVSEDFELFSDAEVIDLDRLSQDRNRCAHPSFDSNSQPFSPPAELARLHIVNAIVCSLQHPPVQGKNALDRTLREIESRYFPSNLNQAIQSLSHGPLFKPRESLVRNVAVVLLKRLLDQNTEHRLRDNYEVALQSIRKLHHSSYRNVMTEKLSSILRAIPDEQLSFVARIISMEPSAVEFLDEGAAQRVRAYVMGLPSGDVNDLEYYFRSPELQTEAMHRSAIATVDELQQAMFFDVPGSVADRIVDLYVESKSFDEANHRSRLVSQYLDSLSHEQIERLLGEGVQNTQITSSYQFPSVVRSIVRASTDEMDWINDVLRKNDLEDFVTEQ